MKNKELFSLRLKEARRKLRLSQPAMAEKMGMSERQYASYEKGVYDKNEEQVEIYSIRLEQVLTESNNPVNTFSFPQKEVGVVEKIRLMEEDIKQLRASVLDLYQRLPKQP